MLDHSSHARDDTPARGTRAVSKASAVLCLGVALYVVAFSGACRAGDDEHDARSDAEPSPDTTREPASEAVCAIRCPEPDAGTDSRPVSPDAPRRNGCLAPEFVDPAEGTGFIGSLQEFGDGSTVSKDIMSRAVKFVLEGVHHEDPWLYFTWGAYAHHRFMDGIGCDQEQVPDRLVGELIYRTNDEIFLFVVDQRDTVFGGEVFDIVYRELVAGMPLLAEYPVVFVAGSQQQYEAAVNSPAQLAGTPFDVAHADELAAASPFVPLNLGVSYGRLRFMAPGDRPGPMDIVVYETIPDALPQVAGIVTTVVQTPLSHVNLLAVQFGVPNAYVDPSVATAELAPLDGEFVRLEVSFVELDVSAATEQEVFAHHEAMRPHEVQILERDLSVTDVRPLDEIHLGDTPAFGAKATGVAELRHAALSGVSVPDGYAVPLSFYFAFMRANRLDDQVDAIVRAADGGSDTETLAAELDALRSAIRRGSFPAGARDALGAVQQAFPPGTPIRCRSSTNAEDLRTYSGAGLYDSVTHRPDEGHLEHSIRQVYESLWTERAFGARQYARIDHRSVGMGVLLHPNFDDERVNSVAVSFDPFYGAGRDAIYLNVRAGENLVTAPDGSNPTEELLVGASAQESDNDPFGPCFVLKAARPGETLLTTAECLGLRDAMLAIRDHLMPLYDVGPDEPFEIEAEFKVTEDGELAIKQARPWIFFDPVWTADVCSERCP